MFNDVSNEAIRKAAKHYEGVGDGFSIRSAADTLQISRNTLYTLARQGYFRILPVSNRLAFIPVEDLLKCNYQDRRLTTGKWVGYRNARKLKAAS